MKQKVFLRKTCSIYASDLHLATMIFPFISKELEKGSIVIPILEKDISNSMKMILNNVGTKSEIKEEIKEIDWTQTNIEKIENILENIEGQIKEIKQIHLIIAGTNLFIEKINKLLDLWIKARFSKLEENELNINIVNCYDFDKNNMINDIMKKHEYILKTSGIEKIYEEEEKLKKAN